MEDQEITETPDSSGTETPVTETTQVEPSYIGFEEEQPAATETQEESTVPAWELGVEPDLVIGKRADGTPILAKEIHTADTMFQPDYTRKTQALAEREREFEEQQQVFQENYLSYIERITGEDKDAARATLLEIAQQYGIPLETRARDANGRFAPSEKPDSGLIDLSQYEEGSVEWVLANNSNLAHQRAEALEKKLDGFLGQVQTQAEKTAQMTELQGIAQKWSMVPGLNVEKATTLIGQQITPQQAMMLANFEAVNRYNAEVATRKAGLKPPDEPGGRSSHAKPNPADYASPVEYSRALSR